MTDTTWVVAISLVPAALRQATPLIFAGLGGISSERAGVVNIALEGMMLTGAFVGVWAGQSFGVIGGLGAALISGVAIGLVHFALTQKLRVNHIVSGVAINLLAVHGTTFLLRRMFHQAEPHRDAAIQHTLSPIPFVVMALLLPVAASFVLFRTPFGLRLRAVGESPESARMAGLNPARLKLAGVLLSGVFAAAGGAYLALAQVGRFSDDMVSGRGYIALAAVICGRWRPIGMAIAALAFGFFDALQIHLQGVVRLPGELLLSLPYLLTILAAVMLRPVPPAALGRDEEAFDGA
jgi:general nucleoside transport system permease protein